MEAGRRKMEATVLPLPRRGKREAGRG